MIEHQLALERQNEALRRTQAALEAGWARYFNRYDLAPVGYLTLDEQGLIREANLTAATLFGTTRDALVRQPLSLFILQEERDRDALPWQSLGPPPETDATGSPPAGPRPADEPKACELRMVKQDGAIFWAHLDVYKRQPDNRDESNRLSAVAEERYADVTLGTELL